MSRLTGIPKGSSKLVGIRFSLDAWAVALALSLAALIWLGLIKHVPW